MPNPPEIAGLSEEAEIAGRHDIVARLAAENVALRCLMGGGCDANNDGLHTTMKSDGGEFCINCGEMTRRGKSTPWFNEARLERTIARLAHLLEHPNAD